MTKGNDLGHDPIGRLVLRLAIPSMIAQFVNVLYSIIDRMYIGNIPSTGGLALAGVGVCGPIVTLLSSFGTLVGLGGSILMAMRMGEGNKEMAKKLLANSFRMLTVFSFILTVVFLITKNKLLMWFGASEATFYYANTYLSIYTAGTFFALMAMGLNYFINCQGFSTVGMMSVVIGAVSNIILDPIFIFVFNMGVAGAAVATVMSQILSFLFAASFLFGKRPPIKITFGGYSLKLWLKIISIGISPFIILATDSIIIIVMNAVLQRTGGADGDTLITCVTIVQSYFMLITCPMIGISGGTQAIISFNYGACESDRIRKAEKDILLLCIGFTTVMFIISRLVPQYFVALFTSSAEYTALSVWGIKVFTLAIVPLSFQYVLVDGLTALGRTKTALFFSINRKCVYCIAIVAFAFLFGAKNAFYAQPAADFVCSCISTAGFWVVFNKHLKKREELCGKSVKLHSVSL